MLARAQLAVTNRRYGEALDALWQDLARAEDGDDLSALSEIAGVAHRIVVNGNPRQAADARRIINAIECLEGKDQAKDPTRRPIAVVGGCRVLGGHGLGVQPGTALELRFTQEALNLVRERLDQTIVVPYVDIVAFEIGGPGARKSGGGVVPFVDLDDITGAAESMLVATALNMLTTRTKVDTVICLSTASAELFVHNGQEAPDALRIRLSRVFNILRSHRSVPLALAPAPVGGGAIDKLERLAKLRDAGILTEEEFKAARGPLIRQLTEGG